LPSQQRERLFRGFQAAAALLMLHQLAGKGARDGYFLTWFGKEHLPEMVAAAAVFAVLTSYLAARLFAWRSPARALPYAFLVSGVLQIGEWALLAVQPKIASVLVYLHTFGLGAVLFSGFWSMLSEEFDPREAKRKIGRISAAGTVGGLAGGLLGDRLIAWFGDGSVMLLLSLAHLACGAVLLNLAGNSSGVKEPRKRPPSPRPVAAPSEEPKYLRTLAALVLLAAISASLLDFAFKFSATAHFGRGQRLTQFLMLFYTGCSLLTFLLQSLATNKSLESLGLGKTMAALPATAAAGSCLSILFPGVGLLSAVRGAEAGVRNSLFKSGYEVCFTPLPSAQKRRIKTIVDVGAERAGDFTGSVVAAVLRLATAQPLNWFLAVAGALAGGALALVSVVDRAYVKALARSLMHRGAELDLTGSLDLTTKTVISRSGLGAVTAPSVPASMPPADLASDPALLQVAQLRSGDAVAVRNAVAAADAGHPLVAAQLVQLLGSREVGAQALTRLQTVADRWVGLFCDCLAGTGLDYEIRRKIPGLLAGVPHQRAVDGLLVGLSDDRFEVRAQCSRALLRLKRARPELRTGRETILAAVERELSAGMVFGEGQRLMQNESDVFGVDGLDEFLKERSHAGLQHVFSLLALEYPEAPLLMAFRALQMEDRRLRATALEYLETILPAKTRQLLWNVVGEERPAAEQRQPQDILQDLMKASATVMIRMKTPE
jgi:MFS family permease